MTHTFSHGANMDNMDEMNNPNNSIPFPQDSITDLPPEENMETETREFSEEESKSIIDDIVALAKKSYKKFEIEYKRHREDRKFFSGQDVYTHDDDISRGADREKSVLNLLNTPFHAIVNSFRKSPYSIRVSSEDSSLNVFVSEASKMIKSIEDNSNYKQVYSQALSDAVAGSRGYLYLSTDEFPDGSANIIINAAQDPTMVIYDASIERGQSFGDAAYAGFIEFIDNETARNKYPKANIPEDDRLSQQPFAINNINAMCSPPSGSTVILNYFEKDYTDPDTVSVNYYKIIGEIIVSYVQFKGLSKIPAAPIYGNEYWEDDKRIYKGIVRDTKESCTIIDYAHSQLKERLSTPTVPFIFCGKTAVEGFFDSDYRDANRSLSPVKRYQDFTSKGEKIDPPSWVSPQYKIDDVAAIISLESSIIESIIGVGIKGIQTAETMKPETATEILQNSNATVNNLTNFYESAKAAITYMGSVIVEILGINQGLDEISMMPLRCTVSDGPELILEKQERRRQLLAMSQIVPDSMKPVILAQIVRTMDLPNAEEIYQMSLRALPDNLKNPSQIPAVIQQKMTQADQQIQQLQAALQQANKAAEDANSKLYTAEMSNANEVLIARMQNENAIRLKLMDGAQGDKEAQNKIMADAIAKRQESENEMKAIRAKMASSIVIDNSKKQPRLVPVPVPAQNSPNPSVENYEAPGGEYVSQ